MNKTFLFHADLLFQCRCGCAQFHISSQTFVVLPEELSWEQWGTWLHLPVFWLASTILLTIISPSLLRIVSLCLFLLSFPSFLPPSIPQISFHVPHPSSRTKDVGQGGKQLAHFSTQRHSCSSACLCMCVLILINLLCFFSPRFYEAIVNPLFSLSPPHPPPCCLRSWERAGKRRSSVTQWKPVWKLWGAALAPGPPHSLHGCRKIFLSEVCLSFWAHGARLIPGPWSTGVVAIYSFISFLFYSRRIERFLDMNQGAFFLGQG